MSQNFKSLQQTHQKHIKTHGQLLEDFEEQKQLLEHMEAEYHRLMASTNQQENRLFHLETALDRAKEEISQKEKEIAQLVQRNGSSPQSGIDISGDDIVQVSHSEALVMLRQLMREERRHLDKIEELEQIVRERD